MKDSRLIHTLKLLRGDEYKDFKTWLKSPWFNRSQINLKLFKILIAEAPNFDSPRLTKEYVFKKLYRKEEIGPRDDMRLRNNMSSLTSLIRDYLTFKEFKNNTPLQKKLYAETVLKRGKGELAKDAEKLIEREIGLLSNKEVKGSNDYMRLAELSLLLLDNRSAIQGNLMVNLEELEKSLDAFYSIQKAKVLIEKKYRSLIVDDIPLPKTNIT